jgi:hypothetical protein
MRPKPTRDWVMLELERLGVRVVSGRLGRKAGDEDDSEKKSAGRFNFPFVAEYYDLALVVLHQMLVQVLHLLLPETTVWAGDRLQTWTL